jgi:hypothetical protein
MTAYLPGKARECDVEIALYGASRTEQSFDRTVSMKPCCSLTIRKFFVFDAKFSSEMI